MGITLNKIADVAMELKSASTKSVSVDTKPADSISDYQSPIKVNLQLKFTYNNDTFPLTFQAVVPAATGTSTKFIISFTAANKTELIEHLQQNRSYNSRAIYMQYGASALLGALANYTYKGKALLSLINPQPIGTTGNALIFLSKLPENAEELADWQKWLNSLGIDFQDTQQSIVPLPCGGTFAEAVLGRSNSAEFIDLRRFWNWQDSPIPIQAPDLKPVSTDSRVTSTDLKASPLGPATLNIVNAAEPNPTGMAAILAAIQNGNMFRDMSGLAGAIALSQAGMSTTKDLAAETGKQAGSLVSTALQANLQRDLAAQQARTDILKTIIPAAAGLAATALGGPEVGAVVGKAAASLTSTGGKLNYGRDMDSRGVGKKSSSPNSSSKTPVSPSDDSPIDPDAETPEALSPDADTLEAAADTSLQILQQWGLLLKVLMKQKDIVMRFIVQLEIV